MKIIWVSFHEEGQYCIPDIYKAGFTIEAIITLDSEKLEKRSGGIDYSVFADRYRIPIYKISHINDASTLSLISKFSPDVICVIGWSQILSKQILNSAKLVIGGHASLLPHNRGSAPVNWSIIKGETFTGNTLMQLQEGVDTGKILAQKSFDITLFDSCKTVYKKVAFSNSEMIVSVLKQFDSGTLIMRKQKNTNEPLLSRRTSTDGLINWSIPAFDIYNFIRALTRPYPGAFSFIKNDKIIIWEASWSDQDISTGKPGTVLGFRYGFIPNQCSVLINCVGGVISIHEIELGDGTLLSGELLINYFNKEKEMKFNEK